MDDLTQRLLLTIPIEALGSSIPRKNTTLHITDKNGVIGQLYQLGLHLGKPERPIRLCLRLLWSFHGKFLSWEIIVLVVYHMGKEYLQMLLKSQGMTRASKSSTIPEAERGDLGESPSMKSFLVTGLL